MNNVEKTPRTPAERSDSEAVFHFRANEVSTGTGNHPHNAPHEDLNFTLLEWSRSSDPQRKHRQPTETELLQLAARIYGLPEHRPEAPADRRQKRGE